MINTTAFFFLEFKIYLIHDAAEVTDKEDAGKIN